jgi:hypothetical protein
MDRTTSLASTDYSDAEFIIGSEDLGDENKKKMAKMTALQEELANLTQIPEKDRAPAQRRRIKALELSIKAIEKQIMPKATWGGKKARKARKADPTRKHSKKPKRKTLRR